MKKALLFVIAIAGFSGMTKAQMLNINGNPVDFRVYSAKTQTQVADLVKNAPLEIKKLNFYYSSSYVLEPSGVVRVPKFDPNSVNVQQYESQRLENERKTIVINQYNDKITLLSKKELEAAYKAIK